MTINQMPSQISKIGGLVQYGQPADFFATERTRKALSGWGLASVFTLACLPFLSWQHPALMSTWQAEWFAALAGLATWAVLLPSMRWRFAVIPASIAPAVLLLVVAVWQFADHGAATRGVALLYVLEMVWAILIMLAAVQMDGHKIMLAVGYGLLAAGLIGGTVGIIQALQLPRFAGHPALFAQDGLAYGFVAQRNEFADVQFMALLGLAFLPMPRGMPWARWIFAAGLAISAAASGSNALVLYVIWGAAWGAVLLRHQPLSGRRMLALVAYAASLGAATFVLRAHLQHVSHVAGAPVLIDLWKGAAHAIARHPIMGIGLGRTPGAFYNFAAASPHTPAFSAFHTQAWNNVHNLALQLWMEAGLAGLAVAALLAALLLGSAWGARTTAQCWAVALLGVLALHSMVEFPLWTLPFLGLASILLAVAGPQKTWQLPSTAGIAPVAVGAVAALFLMIAMQMNAQMSVLMQIWGYPFSGRNIGANIEVFGALDREAHLESPSGIILRPFTTLVQGRFPVVALAPDQWAGELARQNALMRLMPSGYVPYVRAELMALTGHRHAAAQATAKALRAQPGFAHRALEAMRPLATHGLPQLLPVTRVLEAGQADSRKHNPSAS